MSRNKLLFWNYAIPKKAASHCNLLEFEILLGQYLISLVLVGQFESTSAPKSSFEMDFCVFPFSITKAKRLVANGDNIKVDFFNSLNQRIRLISIVSFVNPWQFRRMSELSSKIIYSNQNYKQTHQQSYQQNILLRNKQLLIIFPRTCFHMNSSRWRNSYRGTVENQTILQTNLADFLILKYFQN